ncbi:sodium:proton antiporter [Agromyces badenianii]|uniref:Sodium:proton antiporter n=1 Tax=Agromyces badenianii TaxID=2080742 RepID=A0A2S0WZ12_9MICO|nr:DUF6328 family protein [Agromyces badenianii]AWB96566.1 sodium:proton antiporter [Agromyces badenianii]PWC05484.1 sodium:proton antiporter [Agromyces badenianii]
MAIDPAADDRDGGRDDGRDDRRDETRIERLDRNWGDILQELRAVQTGTQIITGFLLAAAFQPRFSELDGYQLVLYLVLVALACFATLLGLAPVILHRQLFGLQQKERIVKRGDLLLRTHLLVASLLAAGVAGLIFELALNRTAGFIALGVALVIAAVLWGVVPRLASRRP